MDGAARRLPRSAWSVLLALTLCGCALSSSRRQAAYYPTRASLGAPAAIRARAALAEAQELDRFSREQAVDLYYQAAVQAQQESQRAMALGVTDDLSEATYHQALSGLIDAGQRYGRLDPRRGLIVDAGAPRLIPIRYFGFAWQPQDFSRLTPATEYQSRDIAQHYASPGVGVPLIAERIAPNKQEIFFRPWQPFAVTAVLRPTANSPDAPIVVSPGDYALEFYNPLAWDRVTWGNSPRPLARDLTAPLAATVNETPRQYFRGFTAPSDTAVQPQLVMVEPYQRGKIPVIFIHGLYSDPITWVDMANSLRAQRDLYDRYQFWVFRYPTGGDLLNSAAALRDRLQLVQDTFDSHRTDPALSEMVLIGHSLGGLVSKTQVTHSYDLLWREVAQQPFDSVQASPELRLRLAKSFFFEPRPTVKRVVFIATPHQGSGMSRRLAGRLGSALVNYGSQEGAAYQQLIEDNPHLFKESFSRKRPTTINLLEPGSPFLTSLARMPINRETRLHSIIGTGGLNLLELGDGVVTVASAQHPSDSEIFVPAKHEHVHRHPAAISEVARILRLHAGIVQQEILVSAVPQ